MKNGRNRYTIWYLLLIRPAKSKFGFPRLFGHPEIAGTPVLTPVTHVDRYRPGDFDSCTELVKPLYWYIYGARDESVAKAAPHIASM